MFGLKKSNKGVSARKLNIENLEERIECATKVWNGSQGVTFSSFSTSLAQNWNANQGQFSLPNNGDTLVFSPTTTPSTVNGVRVSVINDMSPDSNGNLADYLRDSVTGANLVNPLVYVDSIVLNGVGYFIYGRDNPQFGPTNTVGSPTLYTISPGPQTPYFPGPTVNPITNISTTPAVPLNIQTSILANYAVTAGQSIDTPDATNANWNYMPINLGNPNAPEGSAFLINVNQEGTWLIMNSDLQNGTTPGNYTLINDVNNNKIIKDGLGVLVMESSNQYTGTTVVQQGLLIVSDNSGLGSSLTNSNVEVYGGTLLIGVDRYGSGQTQTFNTTTIANRNLVLYGGDGYIPTIAGASGSAGNTLTIPAGTPMGELNGRDGLFATPHQWGGTVTLNSNSSTSLATQSATSGDPYGLTGKSVNSITVTNGGTGYTCAPTEITVTILAPGQAAAGAPVINLGTITQIPVVTAGSGYTTAPIVTISGGGPTVTKNATATATILNGFVTAITITNPGAGYTQAPIVNIQAPGQA